MNRFDRPTGGFRESLSQRPRRRLGGRYLVPLVGFGVLIMLSFTLIGMVMLRPWAGPDKSWRTHLNLTEEPLSNYTRSVQTFVTEEGSAPQVWRLAPCGGKDGEASTGDSLDVDNSSCGDQGRVEFVVHGCAQCHGLDAKGGFVGPPLAGKPGNVVEFFARRGTSGMPAFSEEELTSEHLGEIVAYLGSLESVVLPTPTPTPTPRATQATPTPSSQAPLTTGTPPPTLSPAELEAAQQLFMSKTCGICHGAQAQGGMGSRLVGLAPDTIRTVVRTGRGGMPPFSASSISDQELERIIAYLQNLE